MVYVGHGALIGRGTYRAWHIGRGTYGGKVSLTYESSLKKSGFGRSLSSYKKSMSLFSIPSPY